MNGDEHAEPHTESAQQAEETDAGAKEFEDLKDAVRKAWEAGASKARDAADEAIPKTKGAIEKAAYEVVYELAYGATFASTVVGHLVPDVLRKASKSGATAGEEAAQDFVKKRGQDFDVDSGDTEPVY